MTNDGRWALTWDAENRLTRLQSLTGAPMGSSNRLTFTYDAQGRRVSKATETFVSGAWSITLSNRFVYDGWNLIAELNATNNAVINSFLWGLDLSGTMQGAGGVGGLLAITTTNAGAHFVGYDGNGNVPVLVSASSGIATANYEYNPFGSVLRATGPMALLNPFRFSTKYTDGESGFNYYGYRFYNPAAGRWVSRDPIAELSFVAGRLAAENLDEVFRLLNFSPEARVLVRHNSYYRQVALDRVNPGHSLDSPLKVQPDYVFIENSPVVGYDPHGDLGHIAGGALIGCGAGVALSLFGSFMSGDNACQCICKATLSCGIGAAAGALAAANPAWGGCLAGAASGAINGLANKFCDSVVCGQGGDKPVCMLIGAISSALVGCGLQPFGNISGAHYAVAQVLSTAVGQDLTIYCNLKKDGKL